MKIKNIMLFCYDFPHKKTQDFMVRLISEGYHIDYVIGAPWKKLPIQKPHVRITLQHEGLIHPSKLCKALGIPYLASGHESLETIDYLKKNPVDLYIISGARILSKEVINACSHKILNIHPGLLPQARGLDTLLWSIYYDLPIGITSHFISPKVDKGTIIYKEKLGLNADDTILDVSLRLLEKQGDVLIKTIQLLGKKVAVENIDFAKAAYNTKMTSDIENRMIKQFAAWLKKHVSP